MIIDDVYVWWCGGFQGVAYGVGCIYKTVEECGSPISWQCTHISRDQSNCLELGRTFWLRLISFGHYA